MLPEGFEVPDWPAPTDAALSKAPTFPRTFFSKPPIPLSNIDHINDEDDGGAQDMDEDDGDYEVEPDIKPETPS